VDEIGNFNSGLDYVTRATSEAIRILLDSAFGKESSKLFHGSPVWFLDGNPIVGYSKKKKGFTILFWSGQSFREPGLSPVGKYKAAELLVSENIGVPLDLIKKWIAESKTVVWDYKNIAKKKGVLMKLPEK